MFVKRFGVLTHVCCYTMIARHEAVNAAFTVGGCCMSDYADDRFQGEGERPSQAEIDDAETNLARVAELEEYLRETARTVATELHALKALDLRNYPPTSENSPEEVIEGAAEDGEALFARLLKKSAVKEWKQTADQADG